ncbi:MAG: hypothetical protein ACJ74Y_01985, partial [Bryobacteraceae bacterium]
QNVTSATVSGLADATTYYFAVTAYNSSYGESMPSNEVSCLTAGTPPSPTPTPTATPSPTPTSSLQATYFGKDADVVGPGNSLVPDGEADHHVQLSGLRGTPTRVQVTEGAQNHWENPFDGVHWDMLVVQTGNSADLYFAGTVLTQRIFHISAFYADGTIDTATVAVNTTPAPTATPIPTASPTPTPVATPVPTPIPSTFVNVSTRASVQTGDNVLIGGLIISGTEPKRVLLRTMGPTLSAVGVAGAMNDPQMSLHDSTGARIAFNDNWRSAQAEVEATGLAPSNDAEAAIVATLAPGAYTAILSGAGGTSGVALLELYDLDHGNSRIANISTRSKVGTGDSVMIGGFIVGGEQPAQVVVRALGPSLASAGVEGALADPVLELYNSSGSRIFANDNWAAEQADQIAATSLAPSDPRESAIAATIAPGAYTAIVRGAHNLTGVALVEVYYVGQ